MDTQKTFIALYTLVKREVIRTLRIWPQTIIPPVITISLYFIIFGEVLFRNKVIITSGQNILYSNYLIPGLVIMAIINSAYSSSSSSFFISKFHKNMEEIMVSPMPIWIIILGFALGGVFRGVVNGLIVFITAIMFVDINIYSIGMAIITAFFIAMFFSLAGIMNAIFAKNFDDISWFPQFILNPMVYLGGVFFSISMLSDSWKIVAQLNPIYYFVSFFRYNLLGIGENFSVTLFGIIAVNILLFLLTVLAFKNRMQN
ncbi:MAG: ABC transporter permease [Rickettsiales bacterium]|nr:ABC transporter permease [Rickettsiales bacterium]